MKYVVATWIFNQEKLLLIKHKRTGKWLAVGGHIKENELPVDAAKRESKEEVNLEIEFLQIPNTNSERMNTYPTPFRMSSWDNKENLFYDFLCVAKNPEKIKIQEEEILDYKWVTKEELNSTKHVGEDIKIVGKYAFKIYEEVKNDEHNKIRK